MARSSKGLRETDIKKRYSVPTGFLSSLPSFNGDYAVAFQAVDGSGRVWPFRCSIRKKGHPKPVISKGWRAFVDSKGLKVGDKVQFYKKKNEAGAKKHAYEIRAEKEIKIFGSVFGSGLHFFFIVRAMDYYKKERVGLRGLPIVNGGTINAISTSKVKEEPIDDGKKAEEPVLNQDEEMHDVPALNLDQKKAEDVTLADTHEAPEELVSTPNQKDHAQACTPSQDFPDQALGQDGLEKPVEIPSGNKIDGVPSEPVNSAVEGSMASPNNASQASSISPTEGVDNNALQCAEEGWGLGDAICGALFFSDDSLKASGALMLGSNESGSVILSRIHHSPESTH